MEAVRLRYNADSDTTALNDLDNVIEQMFMIWNRGAPKHLL